MPFNAGIWSQECVEIKTFDMNEILCWKIEKFLKKQLGDVLEHRKCICRCVEKEPFPFPACVLHHWCLLPRVSGVVLVFQGAELNQERWKSFHHTLELARGVWEAQTSFLTSESEAWMPLLQWLRFFPFLQLAWMHCFRAVVLSSLPPTFAVVCPFFKRCRCRKKGIPECLEQHYTRSINLKISMGAVACCRIGRTAIFLWAIWRWLYYWWQNFPGCWVESRMGIPSPVTWGRHVQLTWVCSGARWGCGLCRSGRERTWHQGELLSFQTDLTCRTRSLKLPQDAATSKSLFVCSSLEP